MNLQFDKIKKIDEYAKSMGITIYDINYGFLHEEENIISIIHDLNFSPERAMQYPDSKVLAELI